MADDTNGAPSLVDAAPREGAAPGEAPVLEKPVGESAAAPPPEKIVASGPWINEDGTFTSDWTNRLPEDVRGEAANMKLGERVRSVADLARFTVNSQRLVGKKGIIPPNEKSTPEEVSEYRKAMGVPETIEGYQVKPETLPEGMEWNDVDTKPFLEIAHKYHAPAGLMKELVAAHISRQAELAERMNFVQTEMLQKKYDEGTANLQAAWGRKYETNRIRVQQALTAVGCPTDDPGLISPNVVKAILNLRDMVSDERFVAAAGGSSAVAANDPGQLANSIIFDKDNPDHARYHNRDPQTTAKVEDLFRQASRLKALNR